MPLGATSFTELFERQEAFLKTFEPSGDIETDLANFWLGVGATGANVDDALAMYHRRPGNFQRQMITETRATLAEEMHRVALGLHPREVKARHWRSSDRDRYLQLLDQQIEIIDAIGKGVPAK